VEVQAVTVSGGGTEAEAEAEAGADTPNATTQAVALSPEDAAEQERQHQHREKLRLKGEKAREKERLKEQEIADENANAGPAPRDVEMQVIISKLPEGCVIEEVAADGHCLYRAVAAHSDLTYTNVRDVCADALKEHEADFSPFCEYTDDIPDYATYVGRVRSSAEWGGHLELRALSMALRRPVIVYSAQSLKPLVIEHAEEQGDAVQDNPIRLSYHLNYYSLGEHYNRVVTKADDC
jgi:OTU domain-containing protein 6